MLMTFSEPVYMDRILSGIKIHTIRADRGMRWKVGMKAHMWTHSPRNVSKGPFQFAEAEISDIKKIEISKTVTATGGTWSVYIDGGRLSSSEIDALAKADGFDSAWLFIDWFQNFEGRLIFWKNLRRVEK